MKFLPDFPEEDFQYEKNSMCHVSGASWHPCFLPVGETTETQPSGTAGTEGTEPAEGTDSPEATSGTEATETTEPSQETESTSYTELTESTKTTESTEPSGTTGTAETVAPDGTPVVIVTNGTQSVSCYITEQSPGTAGGFDLTEDYTLLPTLTARQLLSCRCGKRGRFLYQLYAV